MFVDFDMASLGHEVVAEAAYQILNVPGDDHAGRRYGSSSKPTNHDDVL